jgi:hypothetical protein
LCGQQEDIVECERLRYGEMNHSVGTRFFPL